MKCPICGEEHPKKVQTCPNTGEQIKKMCMNKDCSFYHQRLFDLNKKSCPCCGGALFTKPHEYVDLGLSVKWATCNIGASEPEGYGEYFAWGEIEQKEEYASNNYKFSNRNWPTVTKYTSTPHSRYRDNKSILEPEDDTASVKWGDSWRLPTIEEWDELLTNCKWKRAKLNGVCGYIATSKKKGYKDKSIFLPAAGYHFNNSSYNNVHSDGGYYWSSSLYIAFPENAHYLYLTTDHKFATHDDRFKGLSIRPVTE